MIKCTCGREWPCSHTPSSWHTPAGVRIDDAPDGDVTVPIGPPLMHEYDTHRCVVCGYPAVDHVPAIRYPLKAWMRHYLIRKAQVMFGRRR